MMVGSLGPRVPLAREQAASAGALEANAKSADAGEEVDERERGSPLNGRARRFLKQREGRLVLIQCFLQKRHDEVVLRDPSLVGRLTQAGMQPRREVTDQQLRALAIWGH